MSPSHHIVCPNCGHEEQPPLNPLDLERAIQTCPTCGERYHVAVLIRHEYSTSRAVDYWQQEIETYTRLLESANAVFRSYYQNQIAKLERLLGEATQ